MGMSFNVQKCKVMHVGRDNSKLPYFMAGLQLETTEEERDLGVVMSSVVEPEPAFFAGAGVGAGKKAPAPAPGCL